MKDQIKALLIELKQENSDRSILMHTNNCSNSRHTILMHSNRSVSNIIKQLEKIIEL